MPCRCPVPHPQVPVKTKPEGSNLGPVVIGFFLFVVVGSALFNIIRAATGS